MMFDPISTGVIAASVLVAVGIAAVGLLATLVLIQDKEIAAVEHPVAVQLGGSPAVTISAMVSPAT